MVPKDILTLPDEDARRIAQEDWLRSDSFYSDLFADMKSDWQRYSLIRDTSTDPSIAGQGSAFPEQGLRSNIKIPTVRAHIDTSVAITMANLFPHDAEWLHSRPRSLFNSDNDETQQAICDKYAQFVLHHLDAQNMGFYDKFESFILLGHIYYWSVGYLGWRTKGRYVPKFREKRSLAVRAKEATTSLIKNGLKKYRSTSGESTRKLFDVNDGWEWDPNAEEGPEFYVFHPLNIRPDPCGGHRLEECAFLMDELRISVDDILHNLYDKETGQGRYLITKSELMEIVKRQGSGTRTSDEQSQEEAGENDLEGPQHDEETQDSTTYRDTIVCRRYWTAHGVVTFDRDFDFVMRKERYERWPLYKYSWSVDKTFEGQSMARGLRAADEFIDSAINLWVDNKTKAIEGVTLIQKGMVPDSEKGKPMYPGRIIETYGSPKDVMLFQHTGDVTASMNDIMEVVKKTAVEQFDAFAGWTMGQPYEGGRRLASEIQAVQQGSFNRTRPKIVRVESGVLTPMLNDMSMLWYDRMKKKHDYTIETADGSVFATVDPEFITRYVRDIELVARGTLFVNKKEIETTAILNAINALATNPVFLQELEPREICRLVLRRSGAIVDPDNYLRNPDRLSIPPDHEWFLIQHGYLIEPHPSDNHAEHLEVHQQQLMEAEGDLDIDELAVEALAKHIEETQGMMAEATTINPTGQMGEVSPGQRDSQYTMGNQMSNANNPQSPGTPPPNAGVVNPMGGM